MSQIETGLHEHHAASKSRDHTLSQGALHASNASVDRAGTISSSVEVPFAKVNSVVSGSPAEEAGLQAGDAIRRFGDIYWINHERLSKVAETVQKNEGVSLGVEHSLNLS